MDSYFSKRIGRRMTWIIPSGILTSIMYWAISSKMSSWIDGGEGFLISVNMFFMCLLIAIQDVAIDGLVCDILVQSDYDKGALM